MYQAINLSASLHNETDVRELINIYHKILINTNCHEVKFSLLEVEMKKDTPFLSIEDVKRNNLGYP